MGAEQALIAAVEQNERIVDPLTTSLDDDAKQALIMAIEQDEKAVDREMSVEATPTQHQDPDSEENVAMVSET